MKNLILLLLTAILLNSCKIYGYGNDYEDLPDHYQQRIKTLESFNNLNPYLIYKVSGNQLSEELKNHPKVVVYIFTNGTHCRIRPLKDYVDLANENNYKLFFVMNGYYNLRDTLEDLSTYPFPIYSINNEVYNSNFKPKYVGLFEKDLNVKLNENTIQLNHLFYFENGKFIKTIDEYSGTKPRK